MEFDKKECFAINFEDDFIIFIKSGFEGASDDFILFCKNAPVEEEFEDTEARRSANTLYDIEEYKEKFMAKSDEVDDIIKALTIS